MTDPETISTSRQFPLKRLFVVVTACAVCLAVLAFCFRPQPDRIPEAALLQAVEKVDQGMPLDDVAILFGFEPNAQWLDEHGTGYVCWRFQVSDVAYVDSRASYFVKFERRKMQDAFLLYPLESAGGGMVF